MSGLNYDTMETRDLDLDQLVLRACDSVAKRDLLTLWQRINELRFFEDFEVCIEASNCEGCGEIILGVESLAKHYFRCVRGHIYVSNVSSDRYDFASTIFYFLTEDELGRSVVDASKVLVVKKILIHFVQLSYPVASVFLELAQQFEKLQRKNLIFGEVRKIFKRRRISSSRECYSPTGFRNSESRNFDDNSDLENLSEDEYCVEAILDTRRGRDRKTGKNVKQYLVKWAGYDKESATWEPWMNLRKCRQLVKEFAEKHKKNKQPSLPKARKSSSSSRTTPASAPANNSAFGNKRDFLDELVQVTLNQVESTVAHTMTSSSLPSSSNEQVLNQVELRSSSPTTAALESLNQEYATVNLVNSDMNLIPENYSVMDYCEIDCSEIQIDESGNCLYKHSNVASEQEESMAELSLACSVETELGPSYLPLPILEETVMETQPTENSASQKPSSGLENQGSIGRELKSDMNSEKRDAEERRQETSAEVGNGNEADNEEPVVELLDSASNTENPGKTDPPALVKGREEGAVTAEENENDSGVDMAEIENSTDVCNEGENEATYCVGLFCDISLGKVTKGVKELVSEPIEIQPEFSLSTAENARAITSSPVLSIHGIECEVESHALDPVMNKNQKTREETVVVLEESQQGASSNVEAKAIQEITREQCQIDVEPFNFSLSGERCGFTLSENSSGLKAVKVVRIETELLNLTILEQCNYSAVVPKESVGATIDTSCDIGPGGNSKFVVTNASASNSEQDARSGFEKIRKNPANFRNFEVNSSFHHTHGQGLFSVRSTMQAAFERNIVKRKRTMCAEDAAIVSSEIDERCLLVARELEVTASQICDTLHHLPITPESLSNSSPRGELEASENILSQERPIEARISFRKSLVVLKKLSSTVLDSINKMGSWKVSTTSDPEKNHASVNMEEVRSGRKRMTYEAPKKVSSGTACWDLRSTAEAVSMAVKSSTRSKIYDFHGSSDEKNEDEELDYRPPERRVSRYGRRLKKRRMSPNDFLDP